MKRVSGGFVSDFYCVECGNKGIPIHRKAGSSREAGHLKKLFCFHCNKSTNHAEIRPFGPYGTINFEEEYKAGRFVDGQRVPVNDLISCRIADCPMNYSGKCWNANKSKECKPRDYAEENGLLYVEKEKEDNING